MAIKGWDRTAGGTNKPWFRDPPKKKTPSGGPSGTLAKPKVQSRYGDTLGSVNSTASPVGTVRAPAQNQLPQGVQSANEGRGAYTAASGAGSGPGRVVGATGGGGGSSPGTAQANLSSDPYAAPFSPAGSGAGGSIDQYGYTPQGLASIYDAPEILATDLLAQMGINNPGLAQSLAQYLDPAVAANFLVNQGMGSSQTDAGTMSYANDYMQQMVTPNGQVPQFQELLAQLLGASGADSPLGAYLNSSLTPEEQIRAANGLFGQTLVGLNPYAQQAYSRYGQDQGNAYLGGVAKGQPAGSSYVDYLANSPLRRWSQG